MNRLRGAWRALRDGVRRRPGGYMGGELPTSVRGAQRHAFIVMLEDDAAARDKAHDRALGDVIDTRHTGTGTEV